jgi:hypothetical protein
MQHTSKLGPCDPYHLLIPLYKSPLPPKHLFPSNSHQTLLLLSKCSVIVTLLQLIPQSETTPGLPQFVSSNSSSQLSSSVSPHIPSPGSPNGKNVASWSQLYPPPITVLGSKLTIGCMGRHLSRLDSNLWHALPSRVPPPLTLPLRNHKLGHVPRCLDCDFCQYRQETSLCG